MRRSWSPAALVLALAIAAPVRAQTAPAPLDGVPTPTAHFGFKPGSHRKLANWTELSAYYDLLARTSPRVQIDTLGSSTLGRPFVMLTISSPENLARLATLKEMHAKLADPRRLAGPAELERLLDEGRNVVMITQNIHSTEVGGAQMAPNLLYRLAASNDPEVREVLDEVILLHIPSLNPDGTELVSNWYRQWVGTPHEGSPQPFLYHFYTGHDNNRDWYTFTQKETQHTVRAQNEWHPTIVHDVHQQGSNGARIFVPPFTDPWEPNVDPQLIAAGNQLGMYMAAELLSTGHTGVTTSSSYDAWTPARAYMHYHGGVRILSETASARLATPIQLKLSDLRPGLRYDPTRRATNFPAVWEGGEWGLPQIVDYMETAAFALLKNAAKNRRFWLQNFHSVNQRAVQGWDAWPEAWVIPAGQDNAEGVGNVLRILRTADVEVHQAKSPFAAAGRHFPAGSYVIPMRQPYAAFAQTLLERQEYPNMVEYPGGPPVRPYDVTAHTLPLLMDVEAVAVEEPVTVALSGVIPTPPIRFSLPASLRGRRAPRVAIYKGWAEPMDAGWTRWVFDQMGLRFDTLSNATIQAGDLNRRYDVILFQDQSPQSILDAYSARGARGMEGVTMPPAFAGGVGETGKAALRDFVEKGGRVVAIAEATGFFIDALGLRVKSATEGVPPARFYIPGSILRLDVDPASPLARGAKTEGIAWFDTSGHAFESEDPRLRVAARYGTGELRLSGWVLGGDLIAGKPAILEGRVGKGSVVLFGFQPNYRTQTMATWPLLLNALTPSAR